MEPKKIDAWTNSGQRQKAIVQAANGKESNHNQANNHLTNWRGMQHVAEPVLLLMPKCLSNSGVQIFENLVCDLAAALLFRITLLTSF